MPEYPRSPFEKDGTSITPKVAGDTLDAMPVGSVTPAAGAFTQILPSIASETLAAAKTLLTTDYILQWLNPNGVSRDVTLPAEASSTNLMFIILNTGTTATFNLVVKNAAAATIGTLGPGMTGIFSCEGTNWKWENNSGVLYDSVNKKVEIAGLLSQTGLGGSTYLGFEAGKVDDLASRYNTGIGYQALRVNTAGYYNIALGYRTLYYNTTGDQNIAIGHEALYYNTTGYYNTALGLYTLNANTTGYQNTAVGLQALNANTTGCYNTGIGLLALESNITGYRNIALGYFAGRYELGSDSFYVNNQDRVDTANDKLKSIIYGQMAAAVADQRLVFNANVGIGKMPVTRLDVGGPMQVSSVVANSLGGYVRTFAEATGTPGVAALTFDIAVNVPTGAKLLGAQLRVDTALTAGEDWGAAYIGGSTTALAAAGQVVTKNTKVNKMHVDEITSDVTNVRITSDSGNFTEGVGVIRAIVYYETFSVMGNNP